MWANINDAYEFFNDILNKQQSFEFSGTEFSQYASTAQQCYERVKLGLTELYTVEKREAPQEIQVTQSISDSLRRFIKTATLNKTGLGYDMPADLCALLPGGYLYTQLNPDGTTTATPQPIDFVTIAERWTRLNNYNLYPQLEYPICTYLDNQLVVDPAEITQIQLIYYRYPTTPKWGFTVDPVTDNEVYDPATSVDFEFPALDWENITWLAIAFAAQFLKDEMLYQTAIRRVQMGQ